MASRQSLRTSLLIPDHFKAHKVETVLNRLKGLKTDGIFIPRGMTFSSQPVDVFINRPLKEDTRKQWEVFMWALVKKISDRLWAGNI